MMLTGVPVPPLELGPGGGRAFDAHPARGKAAAAAAAAAIHIFLNTGISFDRRAVCSPGTMCPGAWKNGCGDALSEIGAGKLGGPPPEQPMLEPGDEPLRDQCDDAHDDHGRPDAVGIECALSVFDQHAESGVSTEELADDGADQREAEAHVQARDDP